MSRLIIVSNRLPFTLRQSEENAGELQSTPSTGGLVTALSAYLERQRRQDPQFESLWVGWPGSELPSELEPRARAVLAEQRAYPVFLSREDSDDFYYGFCNRTLWPLFHYFTSYVDYQPSYWETYVRVNRAFCSAVSELVRPGDTLWIHDYQLLLLPEMLRRAHSDATIGFFLHTPFPSYEVFRLLPSAWKQQLVAGMLGADLVGFHVHDYTQHFLQCVQRIIGLEHRLGRLTVNDHIRHVDTFPLGVDFEKFTRAAESERVTARCQQITRNLGQVKRLISVDRLDYTKGLSERLSGYELFLERHPEWHGKVTFVLLVVPSRVEVPRYRELEEELNERVGKLEGRFATIEWAPIVYQYRAADFEELVALYRTADVALITPLRDGMNLVAKEYLACKPDATGVLILSELAGAAQEVNEAILINPNHIDEIADAIEQALTMPATEQVRRNKPIRERLRKYDASNWAKQFLVSFSLVKGQQGELATKQLSPELTTRVVRDHRDARRALFLLDYDGTLVPIVARPELAVPDSKLIGLLARLAQNPKNSVYLISGRDRSTLARWFDGVNVGIVAEHGAWLREPRGRFALTRALSADWKEQVASILQLFVARVAGSFIEEKDYSLAWHYRGADPELGTLRAKELVDELTLFTANRDIQVIEGKKVVEIRSGGVNKGVAASELIRRVEPDFTIAIGDDQTDEDMFRALPPAAATIHVGPPFSTARYCLSEHLAVRALLERLSSLEH
jgi:trehalose 6-phosphate synthase/phosphatase